MENLKVDNLLQLVQAGAQVDPQKIAYTFLLDGERKEVNLTYKALDECARMIAAALQKRKIQPGDRVLMIYSPGLDFIAAFFGCLYAGAVAVPVYPPQTIEQINKIALICQDAQPDIVLANNEVGLRLKQLKHLKKLARIKIFNGIIKRLLRLDIRKLINVEVYDLASVPMLITDKLSEQLAVHYRAYNCNHSTLAFLQYTSGSTGQPKGVMVSHGNLLFNLDAIATHGNLTPDTKMLLWLPPYHDMGLISGILLPLYKQVPIILMSPLAFLQKPLRWLTAISHYKITLSGAPNFAYELCARKATAADKAQLDLSSWNLAFCGAEPIRAQTLEAFATAFAECGFQKQAFFPCYGMAEATLMITSSQFQQGAVSQAVDKKAYLQNIIECHDNHNENNTKLLVSSGKQASYQQILIVNPETFIPSAECEMGEIWVRGNNVALGYWNKPAETKATFQAYLATAEGPFLRTGDLAFCKREQIFITGRLKDVIIIHGRNHYPQDIEFTVERSDEALRLGGCAAFSVEIDNHEHLIIVQELQEKINKSFAEIAHAIRHKVVHEHGINPYAIVFIKARTIPKTTSGKIRRRPCRELYLNKQLSVIYKDALHNISAVKELPMQLNTQIETEITHTKFIAELVAAPATTRCNILQDYLIAKIQQLNLVENKIKITPKQNLFELGFDSIKTQELLAAIEQDLAGHIKINVENLLDTPTIFNMASILAQAIDLTACDKADFTNFKDKNIANIDKTNWVPLSYNQLIYWLGRKGLALNRIGVRLKWLGEINTEILEKAISILIKQQVMLRTIVSSWLPHQRVGEIADFKLQCLDISNVLADEQDKLLRQQFVKLIAKPLCLPAIPKLDVILIRLSSTTAELQLVTPHITSDGYSLVIIYTQLREIYNSLIRQSLPTRELQKDYFDYVAQDKAVISADLAAYMKFWQAYTQDVTLWQIEDEYAANNEAADSPKVSKFNLPEQYIISLKQYCADHNISFTDGFLGIIGLALFSLNKQKKIIIDCIDGGYNRQANNQLVGSFERHNLIKLNFSAHGHLSDYFLAVKKEIMAIKPQQLAPGIIKWSALYSIRWKKPLKNYKLSLILKKLMHLFDRGLIEDELIINIFLNLIIGLIKTIIKNYVERLKAKLFARNVPAKQGRALIITFSILPTFAHPDYPKDWGNASVLFDIDLAAINQKKNQGSLSISLSRGADGEIELWMNNVLSAEAKDKLVKNLLRILEQVSVNTEISLAALLQETTN